MIPTWFYRLIVQDRNGGLAPESSELEREVADTEPVALASPGWGEETPETPRGEPLVSPGYGERTYTEKKPYEK